MLPKEAILLTCTLKAPTVGFDLELSSYIEETAINTTNHHRRFSSPSPFFKMALAARTLHSFVKTPLFPERKQSISFPCARD